MFGRLQDRAEPSLPAGPWEAGAGAAPGRSGWGCASGMGCWHCSHCQWGALCCGWDQRASLQQQLHSPTAPLGSPKRDRPGFVSGWVLTVSWHSKGVALTYLTQEEGIFCLLSCLSHCILVKIWKTYGPTGTIWCLAAGLSPLGKEAFAGRSVHLEPVVVSDGVLLKLQTQKVKEYERVPF